MMLMVSRSFGRPPEYRNEALGIPRPKLLGSLANWRSLFYRGAADTRDFIDTRPCLVAGLTC